MAIIPAFSHYDLDIKVLHCLSCMAIDKKWEVYGQSDVPFQIGSLTESFPHLKHL